MKMNKEKDINKLINDYLESNGMELCKDKVIYTRYKLDGPVPETLYNVLEGFYEFLKHH